MNRREFITGLFGVSVGAFVVAKLEATGLVDLSESIAVTGAPEIFTRTLVSEAWALFQEIATDRGHHFTLKTDKDCYYGEVVDGIAFRHIMGIDTEVSYPATDRGLLRPAMTQLVEAAQIKGIGIYGSLPLPRGVDTAERAGGIRFVRAWDAVNCSMLMRFDLLGASTAENLRTSYRIRGEQTKARLLAQRAVRFRDGMYYSDLPKTMMFGRS